MRRPSAWLLAAWCLLEGAASAAAPPPPCAEAGALPPTHTALRARLRLARTPAAWSSVQTEAEALTADGDAAARACAHFLAGTAAFYRSGQGAVAAHAAAAVAHFVTAQTLAPKAMTGRQPRARMAEAWRRVGAPAWAGGAARAVRIETSEPADLRLSPDGPGPGMQLSLAGPVTVTLRPGRWRVVRAHRCGPAAATLEVVDRLVVPPAPACKVRVMALDEGVPIEGVRVRGADMVPVPLNALRADAGPVVVDAPGYRPALGVALPPEGGEVRVPLARCDVTLRLRADPTDATVAGEGPAPWGAREVVANRAGYAELIETVTIPRPAVCEGATYDKVLRLARPVTVVARDGRGDPITLGRLVVQGESVSPTGFARAPGSYAYQATHAEHGLRLGRFEVPACVEPKGCPPAPLEVVFARRRGASGDGPGVGPKVTLALGGALTLGGLVAGAAAWSTQGAIDEYENKRQDGPLQDLIDQRDLNANLANGLVGVGLVTLTSAMVWYLLSEGD